MDDGGEDSQIQEETVGKDVGEDEQKDRLEGLIARACSGRQDALSELLTTLRPRVQVMILARLSQHSDRQNATDEIAQEVLLGVSETLSQLRDQSVKGFRAWLSVMVSHKVSDFFRKHRQRSFGNIKPQGLTEPMSSHLGTIWQGISKRDPTPSSRAATAEASGVMMEELGHLREDYRQAITLAFFDQLNSTEVGEIMGMKRTAAAMLIMRAVEQLRRRLECLEDSRSPAESSDPQPIKGKEGKTGVDGQE